jgi:hypothetical protein
VSAQSWKWTFAALFIAGIAGCGLWPSTALSRSVTPFPGISASERRPHTEHLYRIVGKARLLLFWMSADNVGGARITWRGAEPNQVLSLLIGSEPQRAPRQVNEWGYIREDGAADLTTVFGIRTVTNGDSPDEAEANRTRPGGLAEFGVLCSAVSPLEAESRTTTVYVPRDATYRDIGLVLNAAERHSKWNGRRTPRPPDTAPGFLSALDRLMRATATATTPNSRSTGRSFAYVYKEAVYDLFPRHLDRINELRTRSATFHDLLRSDMVVRNRATGWTSSFSITYGTRGSMTGVPVTARYQPNWWFRIELELDDSVEVPADPTGDAAINQRVDALCSRVLGG